MSDTLLPNEATEASIVCRNCGSPDVQQWCPVCGQENIPSAVPIREILFGFLDELLKFDAKIWITLKLLVTRPGFLTNAYLMGRRVSYVAPVKLYLAISFVTFIVLAFLPQATKNDQETSKSFQNGMTLAQGMISGIGAVAQSQPTKSKSNEETEVEQPELTMADLERKPGETEVAHRNRVAYAKKHNDACADVAAEVAHREASLRDKVRRNTERETRRDAWISGNQTTLSLLSVPLYALLLAYLLRKDTRRLYVEHVIFALHYQCFEQLSTASATALHSLPVIGNLSRLVQLAVPPIYFVLAARTVYRLPLKRLMLILIGFLLLGFVVIGVKGFTAGLIYQLFG